MSDLTRFEFAIIDALPNGWVVCGRDCPENGKWAAKIDPTDLTMWDRRHAVFEWRLPGNVNTSGGVIIHERRSIRPPKPPTIQDIIKTMQAQVNAACDEDVDTIVSTDFLRQLLIHVNYVQDSYIVLREAIKNYGKMIASTTGLHGVKRELDRILEVNSRDGD